MINTVIIIFSILILLAYFFDLTSTKTRIPTVILLLLLGWAVKEFTILLNIEMPDFSFILPTLGTIGLILIVLEGTLEVEFYKSKIAMVRKSVFGSLLSLFATTIVLSVLFSYFGNHSVKSSIINAIPLGIMSSAIAIPSVRHFSKFNKEFIIYESSLSDIFGVILFNFIALNTTFGFKTFGIFGLELILVSLISAVATLGLSYMLSKIEHHIKFIPIIILVLIIYFISKIYHLPALVFILVFGIFLGNIEGFKRHSWFERFKPDILDKEVQKFKELTTEATFLVRSLFFILFGYLIETREIMNANTFKWAIFVTLTIYVIRVLQLKLSKLPLLPMLFVAPRGIITILLFVSIAPENNIIMVDKSLIIQVIVLTALTMMVGLMATKKHRH